MDRLSVEILHGICSFLDLPDVHNFRLACRVFSDVGACFSHRDIVFYLHQDDLDELQRVSQHPIFAKNVRSLTYNMDTSEYPKRSFNSYMDHYKSVDRWRRMKMSRDPTWPRPEQAADLPPILTEYELEMDYLKYESDIDSFESALKKSADFEALKEVVPRLIRLETITVTSDWGQKVQKKTPFDHALKHITKWLDSLGARHLEALLLALADSSVKLKNLRVLQLDWRLFDRKSEAARRLFSPVTHLTSVDLSFIITSRYDTDDIGQEISQCQTMMKNGVLRRFLQSLTQLQTLNIQFPFYFDNLDDILQPDYNWPHLSALVLQGFETQRQDLTRVLDLHKESLRDLGLQNIHFTNSSWAIFLRHVRNSLNLNRARIGGSLCGLSEDTNRLEQFYLSGTNSVRGMSTGNGCSMMQNNMPDLVNAYCTKSEVVSKCPLWNTVLSTDYDVNCH